jgi:hypothetical protein
MVEASHDLTLIAIVSPPYSYRIANLEEGPFSAWQSDPDERDCRQLRESRRGQHIASALAPAPSRRSRQYDIDKRGCSRPYATPGGKTCAKSQYRAGLVSLKDLIYIKSFTQVY